MNLKNIINHHAEKILHISFYITLCGVSLSLLLTSCAPVAQSVSKNKSTGGGSSQRETNGSQFDPTIRLQADMKADTELPFNLENKMFMPLLISNEDIDTLPENESLVLDKNQIAELQEDQGKTVIENETLEQAETIYIVFVLDLNSKNVADLNQSMNEKFKPVLKRTQLNTYQLGIHNHIDEKGHKILTRARGEIRVKGNLESVLIYTNENKKDSIDALLALGTSQDKDSISEIEASKIKTAEKTSKEEEDRLFPVEVMAATQENPVEEKRRRKEVFASEKNKTIDDEIIAVKKEPVL